MDEKPKSYLIYCEVLQRWNPVLISIIYKEDFVHYQAHFKYLIEWIDECNNPTNKYDLVMDFSSAERNGFLQAYIEHGLEKYQNKNYSLPMPLIESHKEYLRNEAKTLLKGCNHAVVKHETSKKFESIALELLEIDEKEEFYKYVKIIQETWPNTTSWLEWWVYTDAGKMLFPVLSTMDKELLKSIPKTINAQESIHNQYYMTGSIQQSIITGLENLLLFVITLESDYRNRIKDHQLQYGELERWKKIAEKYGTTKPYCGKNSKKGAGIKDRRPPGTTKDLLNNNIENNQEWWSNNVGTMINDNSGLKKIYASFIMRGQLTNKSKKSSYSDTREVLKNNSQLKVVC
ncbi:6081_t:CDS:2 [Entrophospora sp. SA101]|nr:6078_t:CDS:2 [Entrophospora sp. SA101]CAJ0644231.1 6081_t:CDS:2 [Entrophospora sp. SA101]